MRYSQALHDALQDQKSPLARDIVLNKADEVYGNLIKDEPVFKAMELTGNSVETLRQEVTTLYQSEVETKRLLNSLDKATGSYAEAYGAKKKGK